MGELPRACIIGAGSSGITACKVLQDKGIPFDCFEASDRIGGMWAFKNSLGETSAYRSLHINTSRRQLVYSDFPIGEDCPDFPHHSRVIEYFNNYVDHFGFRDKIVVDCAVTRCKRRDDGVWRVTLGTGETRLYDALWVANGHHWDPRWPDPPFAGTFDGEVMHSHHYCHPQDPVDCVDKNVVIVGMGNSALDIACELGLKGHARQVYLSVRRGYYIVPKYIGSDTLDADDPHPCEEPPLSYWLVPTWLKRWRRRRRIEASIGRPEDYGLPKPNYPYGATHPTISNEILIRIGSGDVIPKPNIEALCGDTIRFVDVSSVPAEVLIYATGYNITFPFLDPDFVSAPINELPLFKRVVHPRYNNLFFIGLIQPLCATMPIAELQSRWIADFLAGAYALPPQAELEEATYGFHKAMKARYLESPRHTIQIDCTEYSHDLRKEMKAGRKRAQARGHALTIEPRAEAPTDREAAITYD
ncbi:MAG: NAD(P)-binding domain-containing protein [Alphaproteobacteria bacterium]